MKLRSVWLSLPLRRIDYASHLTFVLHGHTDLILYLRLRRSAMCGFRLKLVKIKGIVLELWTPKVEKHGVRNASRPHVVDDLSPFNLRDGFDRLQLDDIATVKASEVRAPVRRQYPCYRACRQHIFRIPSWSRSCYHDTRLVQICT